MSEGIHPEVLRLLGEILGDDSATLTRISRMRPKQAFPEVLSAGEAFLSKRERHLVEWHREEVARLLHGGCVLLCRDAGPGESGTVFERCTADRDGWERRRARVLRSGESPWPQEREALRSEESRDRQAVAWGRLAVQLVPSEPYRLDLACALAREGSLEEANSLAGELVVGSRSSFLRSAAHTVLGNCHYKGRNLDHSLRAYRRGAQERNPAQTAPVFWLAHATRIGDSGEMRDALLQLERNEPIADAVLSSCAVILAEERRKGQWPATHVQVPQELEGQLSESLRKVLDALL